MLMRYHESLLPTSWSEMPGTAVAYLAHLYAAGIHPEAAKVYLALRLMGVKTVRRTRGEGRYELSIGRKRIVIQPEQLIAAVDMLDFLNLPPTFPVRPDKLKRTRALPADLHGVPFVTYLRISTLARAFAENDHRPDIGDRLLRVLYPDFPVKAIRPWHRVVAWIWVAGLTSHLSERYTDLFPKVESGEGDDSPTAEEQMNTLIRALTGGDILKEQAVLDSDTHRALTELNAKAREAAELRKAHEKNKQ